MINGFLQTFKRANLNLVAMAEVKQGDVVIFRDHMDESEQDRLGIVYRTIRDQAGPYKGIATSAIMLPLTAVSGRDFDGLETDQQRKNIFGERKGIRIVLKPGSQELRNLSVNSSMYYTLGYNVQLPGHKNLPPKDKLRVLSVTSETLIIGEGRTVQKLGSCDPVLFSQIDDAMSATFSNRAKANSLLHAIKEKSQITRDVMRRKIADNQGPKKP